MKLRFTPVGKTTILATLAGWRGPAPAPWPPHAAGWSCPCQSPRAQQRWSRFLDQFAASSRRLAIRHAAELRRAAEIEHVDNAIKAFAVRASDTGGILDRPLQATDATSSAPEPAACIGIAHSDHDPGSPFSASLAEQLNRGIREKYRSTTSWPTLAYSFSISALLSFVPDPAYLPVAAAMFLIAAQFHLLIMLG